MAPAISSTRSGSGSSVSPSQKHVASCLERRGTRDLEKRLAHLERQERKRAEKPSSPVLAEGKRFSAKGLKSHRAKLGLSVADYGLLAGVGRQIMYKYESGQTNPRKAQIAKFVAVRDLGKREARRRLALLKA